MVVSLLVVLPWAFGAAEAHRHCPQPAMALEQLAGKSPRDVRAELSRTLGPPSVETNQLPDGGTFARLEIADLQDGVMQRYAWGDGVVDVVFQGGKTQLVALRVEEFETYAHGKLVLPCQPLSRELWAKAIGIPLKGAPHSSKLGRGQVSLRYDHQAWRVRLRCAGSDQRCTDASVLFPSTEQRSTTTPIEPEMLATVEPTPPIKVKPLLEKAPRAAPHRRRVLRRR